MVKFAYGGLPVTKSRDRVLVVVRISSLRCSGQTRTSPMFGLSNCEVLVFGDEGPPPPPGSAKAR